MSTAASELTAKQIGWIILSVILQQMAFAALAFSYPLLLWISAWVVKVPVVILWVLAFVSSLIFMAWAGVGHYFHIVAKRGWLFVIAAAVWVASYWWFSEREGTPVSYDAMKAHYERQ
jgi:hypothetical protein